MRTPAPVRVIIVNDYPIVVAGLVSLLTPYTSRITVEEATTDLGGLSEFDVILFDTFGRTDARSRLEKILGRWPAKVLIFSWAPAPGRGEDYESLGASGYLHKGANALELVYALEAVSTGKDFVSTHREAEQSVGVWPGQAMGLSSREAEVVGLIVSGLSNEEVANRLFITVNTVKTYIRSAYRKMGVNSRSRAVLWGVEHGFYVASVEPGSPG